MTSVVQNAIPKLDQANLVLLGTTLELLCQTLNAKAVILGATDRAGFRHIANYGIPLQDNELIGSQETWVFQTQTSQAERQKLAVMAARLGVLLKNAIGLKIEQSTHILWILNTAQDIPEITLVLVAKHIQQILQITRELEQTKQQPQNQSKDFGRNIAQSLPIALIVTDLQDRIGFINPALTKVLGYTLEQIYMKTLQDIVQATDHKKLEAAQQTINQGTSIIQRYRILHINGTPTWLEISRYPRFDTNQHVIGSVATLRDISEEMQTQERIERIEHDLRSIQTNLAQGSGFTGRLEDIEGVVGLLQMLASNGTDGAITLDDSIIFLEKGRIVAVEHPKLEGLAAAHALTKHQSGQFQFFPNVKTQRVSMSLDPVALALEHARQTDEAHNIQPLFLAR